MWCPSRASAPLRRALAPLALCSSLVLPASGVGAQSLPIPPLTILQASALTQTGDLFISPSGPSSGVYSNGPLILDTQGRPVWFLSLGPTGLATDLRVQTYNGQNVLTWTQGTGFESQVVGANTDYIADTNYHVIATVQAGNGLNADQHEFQLTPQGTALITIYHSVTTDLSSVGGPTSGVAYEGVAQEINIATGAVVWEWHSLDYVPLTESYAPFPATGPYDYFHINSVSLDTDGNVLISSRHTWTVYKVNRTTGAIIWRLGGKNSSFALGTGLPFAWQHNAEAVNPTTIRIFDNESNGTPVLPASRVIWVTHDDTAMTASITQSVTHPLGLSVLAEGSGQSLANGDTFVDWGILGRISEFDPNGTLLFDATLPAAYGSYRGYRFPWSGTPTTNPTATAVYNADGTMTVQAIWNGATQVATWQVMAGAAADSLAAVTSAPWNGLDTPIAVPAQDPYVQVVALDSGGNVLGTSTAAPVAPAITLQPASQTVVPGNTVVFSLAASGALTYQWQLNGAPLAEGGAFSGTTTPTLVVTGAAAADQGAYTCVATDLVTASTSNPATLAFSATADPGRLINVSCRAEVGTGDNVLITGFALGGSGGAGLDQVLIRASGPALQAFGLEDYLPDPTLQLVGAPALNQLFASAATNPQIAAAVTAVGAFEWTDAAGLDQAQLATLQTGPYTAVVTGQSNDTGIALAEVYDTTPAGSYSPSSPHLVNVSARAQVGVNGAAAIAGFVIGGTTSKTVLIRASGPALAEFGVIGTLPDPVILLFGATSSATPIASNSAWDGDPQVAAAAAAAGAFSWGDPTSHDAAILVTLPPGSYTAQVLGQTADSGVALVEVYEVP